MSLLEGAIARIPNRRVRRIVFGAHDAAWLGLAGWVIASHASRAWDALAVAGGAYIALHSGASLIRKRTEVKVPIGAEWGEEDAA